MSTEEQKKEEEAKKEEENENEEESNEPEMDNAATIIQSRNFIFFFKFSNKTKTWRKINLKHFSPFSDFRGYTIRKRFGPELEEKFKTILNNYNDKFEAHNALLREGLKNEEAAFIVQRWYKKEEKVKKKKSVNDPIHYKLRQADLIQFSQNVSKIYFKRKIRGVNIFGLLLRNRFFKN